MEETQGDFFIGKNDHRILSLEMVESNLGHSVLEYHLLRGFPFDNVCSHAVWMSGASGRRDWTGSSKGIRWGKER